MAKIVLIVDDDPKSMKLSYDLLNAFGYLTCTATNGQQALDLARSQKPDLILLDFQLPVMDGITATRLLKSDPATREIPVIAATASAMKGDQERAYAAGCDAYITKPIDIKLLLSTVKKFLYEKTGEAGILKGSAKIEEQKS